MRRSPFSVYGPFLVIALVQALVIAVAPSRAPSATIGSVPDAGAPLPSATDGGATATDGSFAGTTDMAAPRATTGTTVGGSTGGGRVGSATGATTGAGTGGSTGSTAGTGGTSGGSSGTTGGTTTDGRAPAGDTSHCAGDHQTDVVYFSPTCAPAWADGADNGGATYQGVTADKVTVVYFREAKNQQVTTLLAAENLRATREQEIEFMEAAQDFINKRYETYGREVDFVIYDASSCPETPQNEERCVQEASKVLQELQPFIVIFPVPLYPGVFDVFARAGVISIGGWHFDEAYYNQLRPYRWDVFMDGTQTAEMVGEYYCKKLANKPATNAGESIHRSFPGGGERDVTPRRLGIFVPETDAQNLPGYHLAEIVKGCDEREPVVLKYSQDIDTGALQAGANTQRLIEEQVTTIVCICDPITPIFRVKDSDQNQYYPEHLLAGSGLLDFDKLGRLYNPQTQWLHAFGPSHLQTRLPPAEADEGRVWSDVRDGSHPCPVPCALLWSYFNMAGQMIHNAGPTLNPLTVERGMFDMPDRGGWAETGGSPHFPLFRFGPNDYTGISDAREVWFDNSRPSEIDGRPGSYSPMDNGYRYLQGTWTSKFAVPAAAR